MTTVQPQSSGMLCTVFRPSDRSLAVSLRNDDALSNTWAPRLLGASWIAMPSGAGFASPAAAPGAP